MLSYLLRSWQFFLLIILYVVVGVYARPLLFVFMPLSVFMIKSRDMWPEMIFGFIMVLVLSDMTPWFFEMQVFKTAKNTYISALALIFLLERYRFVPFSKVFNIFLPFFVYSLFPLVFSETLAIAVQKTLSYALLYLIVPNYVLYNYRRWGWDFFRNLARFMAVVLVSGLFINFYGVFYAYLLGRFRGLFGNPNGIANFSFLLIMLTTVLLSLKKDLFTWFDKLFIYGSAVYFLIVSGSRTSLVAVIIFLVFGRFFAASPLFGMVALLGVFGAAELVLANIEPIVNYLGLENYIRLNTLESGSGRYFAWSFAWEHIQDFFVFGGGFGNDERIMRSNRLYLERMGHQGGVHNSFLSFWLDAGIVGLILFLRSFVLVFIKASKLVPMSMGVMFAVLFSVTYESWLVSSLNPYTIILLIIITIVTEEEIAMWDKVEPAAPEPESVPATLLPAV